MNDGVEKVRARKAKFLAAQRSSPITPEMQQSFDKLVDKLKTVLEAGPFHDQPGIQIGALSTIIAKELASWSFSNEEVRRRLLSWLLGIFRTR